MVRVISQGSLNRLGVAAGALVAVLGPIGCVVAAAGLGEAVDLGIGTVEEVGAALDSTSDALAAGVAALEQAETVIADGAAQLAGISGAGADLVEVVTQQVPEAVESVAAALPALEDSARVLDRTMRALSLVGVDYDAAVPLDRSVAEITTRLSVIPSTLRAQAGPMNETVAGTADMSRALLGVSGEIGVAAVALVETGEAVTDLGDRLTGIVSQLRMVGSVVRWGSYGAALLWFLTGSGIVAANLAPLLGGGAGRDRLR